MALHHLLYFFRRCIVLIFRSRNCQIWASDLQSTRSLPISQILSSYTSTPSSSHSHSSSRPPSLSPSSSPAPSRRNLALVLGNEELGISEVMRRESDQLFYVPMKGMTKSYNVSSFSAVLLSTLEAHKEQLGDYLQPLGELEKVSKSVRRIEEGETEGEGEELRGAS